MGDNFIDIDGASADSIVIVSRVIDGFDGEEHVVRGFRYACDLGIESGDYCVEGVYDMKAGIFECTLNDVSRDGLDELLRGTNLKTNNIMKGIFRYLRRDYWRLRGILRDIREAKDYYCTMVLVSGMCSAFRHVDIVKYRHGEDIYFRIPEFNPLFLSGNRLSYRDFWWPRTDRESRIEAFDKLISVYEDKLANL